MDTRHGPGFHRAVYVLYVVVSFRMRTKRFPRCGSVQHLSRSFGEVFVPVSGHDGRHGG